MKTELEIILGKLKVELRNNRDKVNDLLSQNSAYDVAIMFIEQAIEKANEKKKPLTAKSGAL